jgi:HK97 family phage prohead protease
MLTKTCPAHFKTLDDSDGPGTYEAIVSVFGNVDSQGDRVVKRAFQNDLARWKGSGYPIPVIWSHDWRNPFSLIGTTLDAKETDLGLYTKNRLDIDSNDQARQVHRLMRDGRIHQFSFAYEVLDGDWVKSESEEEDPDVWDRGVYELRELQLFEHGPCLVGANDETQLLDVKTRGMPSGLMLAHAQLLAVKEGRVLSAANESRIRDIRDLAEDILGSLGEPKGAPAPAGDPDAEPPLKTEDVRGQLAELTDLRDLYAGWES